MAKLSKQPNNNLHGKLGNVVYYELNGKSYVRSLPTSYRDKKSEKQLLHRKRIATFGQLFQLFRPAIRLDIKEKHQNQSSLFLQLNWVNVIVQDLNTVQINYEQIILCNQVHIKLLNLVVTPSQNKVSFAWDADHVFDDSFLVLCAVYCKGIQEVYTSEVKRNALSTFVNLPSGSGEIVTYTFTYRRTR